MKIHYVPENQIFEDAGKCLDKDDGPACEVFLHDEETSRAIQNYKNRNHYKDKRESFEAALKPLIKWLNDNCHPHTRVIVDCSSAELLEGQMSSEITEFIKD